MYLVYGLVRPADPKMSTSPHIKISSKPKFVSQGKLLASNPHLSSEGQSPRSEGLNNMLQCGIAGE
jgi:hypothetical protein